MDGNSISIRHPSLRGRSGVCLMSHKNVSSGGKRTIGGRVGQAFSRLGLRGFVRGREPANEFAPGWRAAAKSAAADSRDARKENIHRPGSRARHGESGALVRRAERRIACASPASRMPDVRLWPREYDCVLMARKEKT